MDKNIGKKLDGRYEITELIGVGGMAEVYKGVDVIDNKTVAIKILKKEYAENEEFLRRFRNESKAIAVLSHPNIVKIYDVGFSDKIQYIVMEYIDGITLKEYIEEEKTLTWKDTVHFVIQILRALQHAHDKGIVHRDIKPQNIMMFTDGTIKVMDFGIAKFAREEGKTATDQAIGSVHYISPEQASGNVTDAKSDIYSVGAMMYEMLTGQKPFDSDNPVAIAVMHMHDDPERPRAINPDIPDGLEEIVLRAMEKAPEDRYQTTAEMIADIERFKSDPTVTFGYYQEEEESDGEDTRYFAAAGGQDAGSEDASQQAAAAAAAAVGGFVAAQGVEQQAPVYAGQGAMAGNAYPPQGAPQRYAQQPAYNNGYYQDEEDDDDEEEERSSLVVPVLTAVVVVVIIVAVIFVAQLLSTMLKGDKQKNDFTMPNVVGMDYNYANSLYSNVLVFEIESREYSDADENVIIEQSIAPDAEFNKGDTLRVKVSLGQETVEVPDVVNINSDLAVDQLRARNIEYTITKISDSTVQEGYVIKTEPEAGTMIHKNKDFKVVLYVSMGANANKIKVKDYTKKEVEDAKAVAEYDLLKVKTEPKNSYEKEGMVVEQSIEAGTEVEEGTEIILYVSNGVAPDGSIPFRIVLPDGASGRYTISFILRGEDGKTSTVGGNNTIFLPQQTEYTEDVEGAGEDVSVTVMLTNLANNANAVIGTYTFNFASGSFTTDSEDIYKAFESVGAFPAPTIPNLVGQNYDYIYQNDNFTISIAGWEYSDTVPKNYVIRQSPEAGAESSNGATIYVTLSDGPEPTTEPEPIVTQPTEEQPSEEPSESEYGGTEVDQWN